nr:hypothetical protein CFP56_70630 [Quercus suber]
MSTNSAFPSQEHHLQERVQKACAHVALALGQTKYALVGGAACQILGSPRVTEDIDFVVPKGSVNSARRLLAAAKNEFTVEPRTLHTFYKTSPPVEIEILSPPGTFKEDFDQDTSTVAVRIEGASVHVLNPVLILNAKCRSVLGRASEEKKLTDASDIQFLLEYLAKAGTFPSSQQLPNVSKEFVTWFADNYGGTQLWINARYDFSIGKLQYIPPTITFHANKSTERFV